MSEIRVDTISEKTSANGVAIDSVTLKDGNVVCASGNGISFAATGDSSGTTVSELLDDYEEGTWTPTFNGTSGGASGVSYSNRLGWYEKVGRLVTVHCWLSSSSMTSVPSGNLIITGLPFTSTNTANFNNSIEISYAANFTSTESPQGGYLSPNATSVNILTRASSDGRSGLTEPVTCSDAMDGNEQLIMSVSYRTD